MAAMAMPGEAIHAFWLALTTRSTPQASISNGMAPRPLMPSTMTSGSPGAAWTAATSSRSGLATPVEVSLWVSSTARYGGCVGQVGGERGRVGSFAPLDLEAVDLRAEGLRDVGEAVAEAADDDGQHPVAGREAVDDGRLHRAGAGAGQQDHVAAACRSASPARW